MAGSVSTDKEEPIERRLAEQACFKTLQPKLSWGNFGPASLKSGMKGHVDVNVESDVRAKRAGSERCQGLGPGEVAGLK